MSNKTDSKNPRRSGGGGESSMKIVIDTTSKEIAALVSKLQERQSLSDFRDVRLANSGGDDLVVKHNHLACILLKAASKYNTSIP